MSRQAVLPDDDVPTELVLGLHSLGFRTARALCGSIARTAAEADRRAHLVIEELAAAVAHALRRLPRTAAEVWRTWLAAGGRLTPDELSRDGRLSRQAIARQWNLACERLMEVLDDVPLSGVARLTLLQAQLVDPGSDREARVGRRSVRPHRIPVAVAVRATGPRQATRAPSSF